MPTNLQRAGLANRSNSITKWQIRIAEVAEESESQSSLHGSRGY
jgi:hypothetical protein